MKDLLSKIALESYGAALPLYTTGAILRVVIELFGETLALEGIMNGCLYLALVLTLVFVGCLFCLLFTDDND